MTFNFNDDQQQPKPKHDIGYRAGQIIAGIVATTMTVLIVIGVIALAKLGITYILG